MRRQLSEEQTYSITRDKLLKRRPGAESVLLALEWVIASAVDLAPFDSGRLMMGRTVYEVHQGDLQILFLLDAKRPIAILFDLVVQAP